MTRDSVHSQHHTWIQKDIFTKAEVKLKKAMSPKAAHSQTVSRSTQQRSPCECTPPPPPHHSLAPGLGSQALG